MQISRILKSAGAACYFGHTKIQTRPLKGEENMFSFEQWCVSRLATGPRSEWYATKPFSNSAIPQRSQTQPQKYVNRFKHPRVSPWFWKRNCWFISTWALYLYSKISIRCTWVRKIRETAVNAGKTQLNALATLKRFYFMYFWAFGFWIALLLYSRPDFL